MSDRSSGHVTVPTPRKPPSLPVPRAAPLAPRDMIATSPTAPRLIGLAWGFLLVNTLGFNASDLIIPFPRAVGQVITMGLLLAAFAIALVLNPRVRVRPNFYLVVLALLALVATASSLRLESGAGALFRCFRLIVFVATLWLLSGWWRGDLRFARIHLRAVVAVLVTVLLGLADPGAAFSGPDGRLVGALWPIQPPQVGMYSAVVIALSVILWLYRELDLRSTLVIVPVAALLLLLSHTRTAMLGLVVGLLVAGGSALATDGRARRLMAWFVGVGVAAGVLFGSVIQGWLTRGQDVDQLTSLTGRANVWDALIERPRTTDELIIGQGLTDKSFNGLPVDSAWLSAFNELGWAGVAVIVCILGGLLVKALLRPPSPMRTCAIFLVVYSCVASYTEVGLSDASPYLLNLAVAAAMLLAPTPAPTMPVTGRPA